MSVISLYHLASELEAINEQIKENEGVIDESLEKSLDDCGLALRDKASGIIKWTIDLEGKEKAIEAEILRLTKMKTSVSNLHDRLREYVHTSMKRADIQKIELPTMEISVVNNPPSSHAVDEDRTPAEFVILKTSKQIDKRGILDAMKSGQEVPGWELRTATRLKVK